MRFNNALLALAIGYALAHLHAQDDEREDDSTTDELSGITPDPPQ